MISLCKTSKSSFTDRLRLQLKKRDFSPELCYFMSGKLNLNGSNALNAIVLHCSNLGKTAEGT